MARKANCPKCNAAVLEEMAFPLRCCGVVYHSFDEIANPLLARAAADRSAKQRASHQVSQKGSLLNWHSVYSRPRAHWIELHEYPGSVSGEKWSVSAAKEWFADWEERIPKGCGCAQNWKKYRDAAEEVDFRSREAFFEWGVHAHNHVSKNHVTPPKLELPLEEAYAIFFPRVSRALSGVRVLTSCYAGSHIETVKQRRAIASWLLHGATVVSCNLKSEASAVADAFGDLVQDIVFVDGAGKDVFGRDKPSLLGLLEVASGLGGLVCMMNSDIEIRLGGSYLSQFVELGHSGLAVGVRWNWVNEYWRSVEFEWGLDVFAAESNVFAEAMKHIKFQCWAIGWPGWDYVLPHAVSRCEVPVGLTSGRLFFHEDHSVSWELEGDWVKVLVKEVPANVAKFRLDLSRGLVYNKKVGRWLTEDGRVPSFVSAVN